MFTNYSNVDLPLAVWLAADSGYDRQYDPDVISATELLKPLKSLILSRRLEGTGETQVDITEIVASRMGHALHADIEHSWMNHFKEALANLGQPQAIIDSLVINPEKVEPGQIPVYMEQRAERKIGRFTISGKFDFVLDGQISDFKSTSVYTKIKGTNDRQYALQGSIYKWLNPELVTSDTISIQYIFTDWSAVKAKSEPGYPPSRVHTHSVQLYSDVQIEAYINERLALFEKHEHDEQDAMPDCNRVELWQDPPRFAYYANPEGKRATKVFDSRDEAYIYLGQKGKGIVQERPGTPKFCNYCPAKSGCLQAQSFIEQGLLT